MFFLNFCFEFLIDNILINNIEKINFYQPFYTLIKSSACNSKDITVEKFSLKLFVKYINNNIQRHSCLLYINIYVYVHIYKPLDDGFFGVQ
jgi:hypothetical protein